MAVTLPAISLMIVFLKAASSQMSMVNPYLSAKPPNKQHPGLASLPGVGVPGLPAFHLPPSGIPSFSARNYPVPCNLGHPHLAPVLPAPKPTLPPAPCHQGVVANEPSPPPSSGLDSAVLNNLAIALQLLIVSNIMNAPTPDLSEDEEMSTLLMTPSYALPSSPTPILESFPVQIPSPVQSVQTYPMSSMPPLSVPQINQMSCSQVPSASSQMQMPYSPVFTQQVPMQHPQAVTSNPPHQYYSTSSYSALPEAYPGVPQSCYSSGNQMPNANFVGTSGFIDASSLSSPGMAAAFGGGKTPVNPRAGLNLMSPYEALSSSSPYADPILASPYGSVITSKKDFQSPYTMMAADDRADLFSMSDIF